jgi:hypothetical protein
MSLYEQKVAEVWVTAAAAAIRAGGSGHSAVLTADIIMHKFRKEFPEKIYAVTDTLNSTDTSN